MTERPSSLGRSPTAPPIMANGHFAAVGDHGDLAAYEHGVQVVDENKEFKYVCLKDALSPTFPQLQLLREPSLFCC